MSIKYFCLGLLVAGLLLPQRLQAQMMTIEEELFAYEVKQLDEFFERFNSQETLITRYVASANPATKLTRDVLVKSLFNLESTQLTRETALEFIETINNPNKPVYLNFLDNDWFAAVDCSMLHEGKERKVSLILNVEKGEDNALKWVIKSVKADFLEIQHQQDKTVSLNPVSHGTEFLGLSKALDDRKNIRNYLPADFKSNALSVFVHEWKNNRLVFQKVNKISYHFLQVEGWILTVEDFSRKSKNSGWLISNLIKADTVAKSHYRENILKINL